VKERKRRRQKIFGLLKKRKAAPQAKNIWVSKNQDKASTELPGFCLPKGIAPLLPVFREAILNGMPDEKENTVQGMGEVIALTSAASLQPSVVHISGPLIRILG